MKIKVIKPFLDKENELKARTIGEKLTVTDTRADVLISKGFAEASEEDSKQEQTKAESKQEEAEDTKNEKPAPKRGRKAKSTN